MSGDPFRKVTTGEPFRMPAAAYNAFLDAAIAERTRSGQTIPPDAGRRERAIVLVRNESGADVPRFGALGIEGPIIEPADAETLRGFTARVALRGATPALADHFARFVIPIEPIKDGAIGRALIDGVGFARVLVPSGASSPREVDIEGGEADHLVAAPGGAGRVLWIEAGDDGVKRAIVRLGEPSGVFAVDLAQDGGSGGDATSAPSWTYTITDPASGVELAAAVNPTAAPHRFKRPTLGMMTAATFGHARRAGDGAIALGWINETFAQEACPPEEE